MFLEATVNLLAASGASSNFVDIDVPGWAWGALLLVIAALLGVDLFRHRHAHAPSQREALIESTIWVACGLAFSLVVLWAYDVSAFGEYLSGYLTEKALSVDNVFVWSVLFTTLGIPVKYQHRVLFWGIFGALALRAVFIFAGSRLLAEFEVLLVVFGLFLIVTGLRIVRHTEDEGETGSLAGLGVLRRFMPVSDKFDGQNFITRIDGRRAATPLLAALVVVEVTDVIFAVDSVPAILALSQEEFLVFSSNAFAILGLRAMYFLLANARDRFHYLNHGLGAILVFVGAKMSVSLWWHLNVWISLGTITLLLIAAVVFSELRNRKSDGHEHSHESPSPDGVH